MSAKLDGCSFVADYDNGEFVSGTSRGDGTNGTNWTGKLKYILPKTIKTKNPITIRGELVMLGDAYKTLGMKNPRNGVTGIMGEDRILPEKLKYVSALVYDILGTDMPAVEIFETLELDFTVPFWRVMNVTDTTEEDLKTLYLKWKEEADFWMDGLVISEVNYVNEDVYYPELKVAFKVNSEGVPTKVVGVEWNTSMLGSITPVVLLEPVEIDGTTVKRASGYNAKYILDNKIKIGTTVYIIKSGEIIPKIIKVVND